MSEKFVEKQKLKKYCLVRKYYFNQNVNIFQYLHN